MSKNGRIFWVPKVFIDELEDIKVEKKINSHSEAFKQIASYSQVGREMERIKNLDFKHKPRRMF